MTQSNRKPATVVLNHGGFFGAWCWRFVEELLRPRGVPTVAINRWTNEEPPRVVSYPAEEHRIVSATLDSTPGPVVLVGHSAGGRSITIAAAGRPQVRHLVYIAAFMPGGPLDTSASPLFNQAVTEQIDGSRTFSAERARDVLFHDCAPETAAWATAQLRSRAPASQNRSAPLPEGVAWKTIPSTYVICTFDRANDPNVQRMVAARQATEVVEWPTGHSPFLSRPDLVADLLEKLALRYAEPAR